MTNPSEGPREGWTVPLLATWVGDGAGIDKVSCWRNGKRIEGTVLSHHSQGVGPLEGWMRDWLLMGDWKCVPECVWEIAKTRLGVDHYIATAISEILGEDHED